MAYIRPSQGRCRRLRAGDSLLEAGVEVALNYGLLPSVSFSTLVTTSYAPTFCGAYADAVQCQHSFCQDCIFNLGLTRKVL